ncbi:transposase domain-containing protein, partial [Escherichia coli]|nr:transposase domain-containing protein [Escherichia coli]
GDSWPGRAFLPLIPASALRFLLVARKAGTCRLNGIDPEAYLRHILSVLPEWPSNRVDELLPWNVVLTNK